MEPTYKVLKDFEEMELKEGEVVELPELSAEGLADLIKNGVIELVVPETDETIPTEEVESVLPKIETKMYAGKEVISDTMHEVNGIEYHEIKTSEGTTHDLTDEEYAKQIIIQTN